MARNNSLVRLPDWLKLNRSPAFEPSWPSWIQTLTGHSGYIRAMALSRNGQRIVSVERDDTIKIWNATTGEPMKTIQLVDTADISSSLAFSEDGQLILSPSSSNVKLLNAGTGLVERTLVGHSKEVWAVAISHDDQWIASGSEDNSVRLWDANKGLAEKTLVGHSDPVWAVAFSPDSRWIASGSEDRTIMLWETLTGEAKTFVGHDDLVQAVAFSPTGRWIVSGSSDETVRVWDTTTWELQHTLVGHTIAVTCVAFFTTGQRIVSSSYDNTIKIWDTSVNSLQREVPASYHYDYESIAFSPQWLSDCIWI